MWNTPTRSASSTASVSFGFQAMKLTNFFFFNFWSYFLFYYLKTKQSNNNNNKTQLMNTNDNWQTNCVIDVWKMGLWARAKSVAPKYSKSSALLCPTVARKPQRNAKAMQHKPVDREKNRDYEGQLFFNSSGCVPYFMKSLRIIWNKPIYIGVNQLWAKDIAVFGDYWLGSFVLSQRSNHSRNVSSVYNRLLHGSFNLGALMNRITCNWFFLGSWITRGRSFLLSWSQPTVSACGLRPIEQFCK